VPALLIVGLLFSYYLPGTGDTKFYVNHESQVLLDQSPIFEKFDVGIGSAKSMHSITTVVLDSGDLLAAWYAGTREGHTDVEIYSSVFNSADKQWSEPKSILNRYQVSDDLNRYIKKVGNPVLYRHPVE